VSEALEQLYFADEAGVNPVLSKFIGYIKTNDYLWGCSNRNYNSIRSSRRIKTFRRRIKRLYYNIQKKMDFML
jgi:hypothetical protein